MEAEQCATKQPVSHWRNRRGNQKIPGHTVKSEAPWSKICAVQQKQFWEGGLMWYKPISGNRKSQTT